MNIFKRGSDVPETLAHFVRRVRTEQGLSCRDVQERSGNLTTEDYVSKIESGWTLNVTPTKLSGVAKGLGISDKEIFAAAKGDYLPHSGNNARHLNNLLTMERGTVNLKQRAVILVGICLVVVMTLFPPWKRSYRSSFSARGMGSEFSSTTEDIGYHPAWRTIPSSTVNVNRLLAQYLMALLLTVGLYKLIE